MHTPLHFPSSGQSPDKPRPSGTVSPPYSDQGSRPPPRISYAGAAQSPESREDSRHPEAWPDPGEDIPEPAHPDGYVSSDGTDPESPGNYHSPSPSHRPVPLPPIFPDSAAYHQGRPRPLRWSRSAPESFETQPLLPHTDEAPPVPWLHGNGYNSCPALSPSSPDTARSLPHNASNHADTAPSYTVCSESPVPQAPYQSRQVPLQDDSDPNTGRRIPDRQPLRLRSVLPAPLVPPQPSHSPPVPAALWRNSNEPAQSDSSGEKALLPPLVLPGSVPNPEGSPAAD